MRGLPAPVRGFLTTSPTRHLVAAQIFRAMESQFSAEAAHGLNTVVAWKLRQAEGAERVWYLTIGAGRCKASRRPPEDPPTLTLTMDHRTLLDLATGAENGPKLLMAGRLGIDGDLLLAQRLTTLFRIPGH